MPERYILAIDQGTTSSRAALVDEQGRILAMGQREFPQYFPLEGWVEHDPEEIWQSCLDAIADALSAAGASPTDIAAVGIANQRETVVVWERRSGTPIGRAIVWQDRRSAALCEELRQAGAEPVIRKATGLTLDPYFSATKLAWLLRSDAELRRRAEAGELAAGTVDAWLVWKLTGGRVHATDYTNASRTALFHIGRGRWDDQLCDLFGVPKAMLPRAQPPASPFGFTDPEVFGASVAITGVAGDQQAALVGQVCLRPGQAKNTYGTGAFLLAPAGRRPPLPENGLLLSVGPAASDRAPDYVLEGSVLTAGAVVQWLRDGLGIISRSDEVEALAAAVPDSGGVTFVPAFAGLGTPHWDPHARGLIVGITRGTTREHLARAALEAIAFSVTELLEAFADVLPEPIAELRADGGAARNDLLLQLQADLAGIRVVRPAQTETTALGAAFLAGLGHGMFASLEDLAELWHAERVFEPRMSADERSEHLARWRRAVERSRGWAAPA